MDLSIPQARQRRGFLRLELVLTLPVLVVLLLGTLEFGWLLRNQRCVAAATRAGAQTARLPGAREADIYDQVRRSLGPRLYAAAQVSCRSEATPGGETICAIRVPMTACAPNLLRPFGFDLEGEFVACATPSANK